MTSVRCRNKEASKFLPTKPRFFKIIHGNNITQGKLVIPKKFIQNHGNNLQNPVWLKVPTGAVWEIELRKCGTEVWLQEGWQDFAKYYSLSLGNLIVFEYEGDCHFSLLIFDKTATEIEYYHKNDEFNQENSDSVDPSSQIKAEKPPLVCSDLPGKISRTKSSSSADTASKLPQRALRGRRMASVKALQGNWENPFFLQVMKPTNVLPVCVLTIPSAFSDQFCVETKGDVKLCLPGGKSWNAVYRRQNFGSYAQVKIGWSLFVQENSLQVGDTCVFELIDAEEITFKVSISRAVANQSSNIDLELCGSDVLKKESCLSGKESTIHERGRRSSRTRGQERVLRKDPQKEISRMQCD